MLRLSAPLLKGGKILKPAKDTLENQYANCGRIESLTQGEKHVLGGWILSRERSEKLTTLSDIENFLHNHFSILLSKSAISRTTTSLGFSFQRIKISHAS